MSAPVLARGSTSTQRTHRYLRLAIGGTVVVVFVAIAFAVPAAGWLSSISDYFYTPARNAFVGALIAASLALLALSGRGAERTILDAAALFAPLIALVPTVIGVDAIPGLEVACAPCVPAAFQPDVANGVATYLVVLAGVLALGVALSRHGRSRGRAPIARPRRGRVRRRARRRARVARRCSSQGPTSSRRSSSSG